MSKVSIIAAIGDNYAIGKDNQLPWHLPADLKHFKALTTGHAVVMGKRTFESLPNGPLPNRKNIVLTSIPEGNFDKYYEATSIKDAIDICEQIDKVFIIGGASVFEQAIKQKEIKTMHITWIHKEFEADTFFPKFDSKEWQEVSRTEYKADEKNLYDYSICEYRRK